MRVVLTTASLQPSYGGPAFSVSQLAHNLAERGANVGLWAADQSAGTTPVLQRESQVRRLIGTEAEALESFGGIDVLHDNGIWLRHNHRLARLAEARGIPRVVSTRGMLEPWALDHKRWKKRIAWGLYQRRDLLLAGCHHATSGREAENLQDLELGVAIRIIPNGIDIPVIKNDSASKTPDQDRQGEKRTALFLGRLYAVKGLTELIEAWSRVKPEGWSLKIAGPDEAGSKVKLERAIAAAGLQKVVSFLGPLDADGKRAAFLDADLFVLPSHSESFGMAIGEALAHGVPVLTTTAAPWSMLAEQGCGWSVEPTVEGLVKGLCDATSCDRATLNSMGIKGRAFVTTEFRWSSIATQFLSMYEALLGKPEAIKLSQSCGT